MDSDLLVCAGVAGPLASVSCLFPSPTQSPPGKSAGLLLPAPTTSQPALAGAAALPLCIMERNLPKATYSSFATRGRRVAPAGQAAGTGRLKHPRSGVGGQLACLQICLPLRHTQLRETEPDCGKQEQIGRSGSSRVVFLAERAAQLQLSWHAGRAAE